MGNRFCRICGEHKPLTLEHIPPRSTGNDHVVVVHRGDEAVMHSLFDMEVRDDDGYRQSHGMTFKTLCEDCNEYLGANYVETFKGLYLDFAHESGDILDGLDRDRDESETDGVERYCRFDLNEGVPSPGVRQAGGVELLRHDGAGQHARLQGLPARPGEHFVAGTLPSAHGRPSEA